MRLFRRKQKNEKRFKCPLHGAVDGVFPIFSDYTVHVRLCEKCIASMFVRAAEIVEPIQGEKNAAADDKTKA